MHPRAPYQQLITSTRFGCADEDMEDLIRTHSSTIPSGKNSRSLSVPLVLLFLVALSTLSLNIRDGAAASSSQGFAAGFRGSGNNNVVTGPESTAPEAQDDAVELSVVLLTLDASTRVAGVVRALLRCPARWALEVLIVDNGCSNATATMVNKLHEEGGKVRHVRLCDNRPYARANNFAVGLASPSAQWVLFLNDDVLPAAGFLDGIRSVADVAAALGTPVGAVGGQLLFPGGEVIEAGSLVRRDGSTDNFYRYDVSTPSALSRYDLMGDIRCQRGAALQRAGVLRQARALLLRGLSAGEQDRLPRRRGVRGPSVRGDPVPIP